MNKFVHRFFCLIFLIFSIKTVFVYGKSVALDDVRYPRWLNFDNVLSINIRDSKTFKIKVRPTSQRLANEYLPIWSAFRGIGDMENKIVYREEKKAMKKFGGFTMYQDYVSRTAIVHFHKYNILNGVVGMDYVIENLPYNQLHAIHEIGFSPYIKRRTVDMHVVLDSKFKKKTDKFDITMPLKEDKSLLPTKNAYPELLVIITRDLIDLYPPKFGEKFEYQEVLTQILTYFNAMDMLYSKLTAPNIEFNIAKIVLEAEDEALTFCNHFAADFSDTVEALKILYDMGLHFLENTILFPRDTYDQIILLTNHHLVYIPPKPEKIESLAGYAHLGDYGDYRMRLSETTTCVECDVHQSMAAVQYLPEYRSFPGLGHEFAHLLGVEHDELPGISYATCAYIMQDVDGFATKCLRWSRQSKAEIANFFETRNKCSMLNYPRSLSPPEPKITLTKSEQCRCYGFDCSISKCKWDPDIDSCRRSMKCWHKPLKTLVHAPRPMDGTPCGKGKVCWEGACIPIIKSWQ